MLPGFRLHKFELRNWGTFDGNVYSVRPNGATTLLVGQNGSGKSTLVDAILTLLVRPGVRNFNVAAGANKRERDERSYVKGAYDRGGDDDDGQAIQVKFLRPHPKDYSAILACFHNEATDKAFTIAQLLYLGNESVEKIYCCASDERSIKEDFGDVGTPDGLLRRLKERGWRATKTFAEHEQFVARHFHWKNKAMEVLNQTVAVKDIQRLNDFIRKHMLEAQPWDEKVDQLLLHFAQLSEAHQSLVRVRQQFEQLTPIVELGNEYLERARHLNDAEAILAAVDAYWSEKAIELLGPETQRLEALLAETRRAVDGMSVEITECEEEQRQVRNAIDKAGGPRLQLLPHLIKTASVEATQKRKRQEDYAGLLVRAGIDDAVGDAVAFNAVRSRLTALTMTLTSDEERVGAARDDAILERGELRNRLTNSRRELEGLTRRKENLPEAYVALRARLCGELGLAHNDLPFAAELIAVSDSEREWTPAAEKVLRGFALSMLVPRRHYRTVSQHVDKTRLTDSHGRGQRLIYIRVGDESERMEPSSASVGPDSLLRKLTYREGHPLLPWVKRELYERFDYRCCETIEDFQESRGAAVTRNRHVKSGEKRHEKDDRDFVTDPSNFVLGWDNREKKRRIAAEIERLSDEEKAFQRRVDAIDNQLKLLRAKRAAASDLQDFTDYADIDYQKHEREVLELEKEKQAIEERSEPIRLLKRRLDESEQQKVALGRSRDDAVGRARMVENDLEHAARLIKNSRVDLQKHETAGTLAMHRHAYGLLDSVVKPAEFTPSNLFERKDGFRSSQETRVGKLSADLKPLTTKLTGAMGNFLRNWPSEHDLAPGVDYVEGFLALRDRIAAEDLPRLEERFKERLNEKVMHEIGLFRENLEGERRAIEEKVNVLNASLRKLEYRASTHIQLKPRPVRDQEIVGFRDKLRACIEGSFDDTAAGNEARFVRIQELLVRLQDENNRRWREKVTDVRKWFDFVAEVVDPNGNVVSRYEDSSGQSGGEKAKLAFTILVAAIAYQYDIDLDNTASYPDRFRFVVVDEMFSKVDDQHAEYALDLFKQFGLQLLIVAPLDAKARVTQPYVGCYLHVNKRDNRSEIFEMTAQEFETTMELTENDRAAGDSSKSGQSLPGLRAGVVAR